MIILIKENNLERSLKPHLEFTLILLKGKNFIKEMYTTKVAWIPPRVNAKDYNIFLLQSKWYEK